MDTPEGPPQINFLSQDVERLDYDEQRDGELPTLVLYTDLPVPTSFMGVKAADSYESPFIYWCARLWTDNGQDYTSKSNALNAMRESIYPPIRRAASLVQVGDFAKLDAALGAPPLDVLIGVVPGHSVYRFGRFVDLMFTTFCEIAPRSAAIGEFLLHLGNNYRDRNEAHRRLIVTFQDQVGLTELRRKIVGTVVSALEHSDALLPGLAWEHIDVDPLPAAEEFRIARADFDELRGRYVEMFELGSQVLALIGAVVNLDIRGDANHWGNGTTCGIKTMLGKKAHEREFILQELPFASGLFEQVNRRSRNDFGHYKIEYDFSTGELVDKAGKRTSFVLFLVDYLSAARLLWYLFGVCEKLTLEVLDVPSAHRDVAMHVA